MKRICFSLMSVDGVWYESNQGLMFGLVCEFVGISKCVLNQFLWELKWKVLTVASIVRSETSGRKSQVWGACVNWVALLLCVPSVCQEFALICRSEGWGFC